MRHPTYLHRRFPKTAYTVSFVLLISLLTALNTVYQTFYYQDRALPNTFIGDLNIGNKTKGEIGYALLENNQTTKLVLDTGASKRELTYYEAGLAPDLAYMSEVAVERPWWHLIVPTVILQHIHTYTQPYSYAVDTDKVSELVDTINQTDSRAASDARLDLAGGSAVIVPALPGNIYEPTRIVETLSNAPFAPGTTLWLNPSEIAPTVSEKAFEPVKSVAQTILKTPPKLVVNGQEIQVPAEELAKWMTATENTATGFTLAYKNESIQAYVESLNEAYFIPAQAGTVSFVDGTEVSRTGGQAGSGIDSTAAVQAIIDGLTNNASSITLPLSTISARYNVDRNYSNSDSGLYSLISDLVAEYGDYAISIYEFGGNNRYADIKGDNVYIAASTYKLYIAMHALQQLEAGNLDLEAPFAGITVGKCFDLMIHHSDNYCANTFINTFGRQTLTDAVHAEGFSNTKFTDDGIYTTANDLTNFLVKLASTELTNETNRDKLLELMKHQIYRNGIPTGAPDSTVANKVGYYGGYRHDTGIVYGPKSTYALSIVSYAGSYPEIVAMTKKIHAFMQQ